MKGLFNLNNLARLIRKNFYIYLIARRFAPFFCRFFILEEGFGFLKNIKPIGKDFCILDIGSNDGTSIRMIRQFHQNIIHAFDPIVEPRNNSKDVIFYRSAVGDTNGRLRIFSPIIKGQRLTQYSSFSSEFVIGQLYKDLGITKNKISIESEDVDLVKIDDLNLKPFFVKIDVEGFEIDVINGAANTLIKWMPVLVLEIQNIEMFWKIKNILRTLGYICIDSKGKPNMSNAFHFSQATNNYLFVPMDKSPSWAF